MANTNLVLGRRTGEKVLLGPEPYQCEITVSKVENGQVSLKFTADSSVPIDRWEIAKQKGLISEDRE